MFAALRLLCTTDFKLALMWAGGGFYLMDLIGILFFECLAAFRRPLPEGLGELVPPGAAGPSTILVKECKPTPDPSGEGILKMRLPLYSYALGFRNSTTAPCFPKT